MQNNNLTRFDAGGTHETNPYGGIAQGQDAQGNMNTVEQGETKSGNFVYSDRITLDSTRIKQFNLPGYAANKSVSAASKAIEDKFKDRNDKYANETKKALLDRLANAQESVKAEQDQTRQSMQTNSQQAPEDMMGGQIPEGMEEFVQPQESQTIAAYGGIQRKYNDGGYIQGDANLDGKVDSLDVPGEDGMTGSQITAGVVGGLGTGLALGQTAFGKASQDVSGTQASDRVSGVGMIGGSAIKGASAGAAFGPLGAGIGAAVGGLAGLAGLGKARKAEALNTQRFAMNTNRGLSDNYAAYGGNLNVYKYADGGLIDPPLKKSVAPITPITQPQLASNVQSLTGISNAPVNQNMNFNTKQIVRYQPGVSNDKMGQGFYLYSKNAGEPGFDVNRHREFVKQSEMGAVQRTPEWATYMKGQALNAGQTRFRKGGDLETVSSLKPYDLNEIPSNLIPTVSPLNIQNQYNSRLSKEINPISYLKPSGMTSNLPVSETLNIQTPYQQTRSDRFKLGVMDAKDAVGKAFNDNAGEALRYAPIAANLLQLKNLKKPTGVQYQTLGNRYKPSYVDETTGRNIVDAEGNNTIAAISQSGASQGATRNAILGAGLNKTKALSDVYANASAQNRAQDMQAQQFNLNVDQSNVATANKAIDEMRMDQAAYEGAKSKGIANIGNAVGAIGKEQADAKLAKALTGYTRKGNYVYDAKGNPASAEITAAFLRMNQASTNGVVNPTTAAYGGYLNTRKKK